MQVDLLKETLIWSVLLESLQVCFKGNKAGEVSFSFQPFLVGLAEFLFY